MSGQSSKRRLHFEHAVELSLSTSAQNASQSHGSSAHDDANNTPAPETDHCSPSPTSAAEAAPRKQQKLSEAHWRCLADGDERFIQSCDSSQLVRAQRALETARLRIVRERKKRQFWARMRARASCSSPCFDSQQLTPTQPSYSSFSAVASSTLNGSSRLHTSPSGTASASAAAAAAAAAGATAARGRRSSIGSTATNQQ